MAHVGGQNFHLLPKLHVENILVGNDGAHHRNGHCEREGPDEHENGCEDLFVYVVGGGDIAIADGVERLGNDVDGRSNLRHFVL